MNRFSLAFVAAAACTLLVPAAAPAADMGLSSMDCAQGPAMMMSMPDKMDMMASPSPTMTTDQAFMAMTPHMMKHAAMMAGMELKCGKDPAARAQAAKLLQQLNDDGVAEAKDILNTYNH